MKLVVSFGSSGTLATQIVNGAPVDVFLGADFTFPEKVVAAGLADAKAPTPYAQGTLVLLGAEGLAGAADHRSTADGSAGDQKIAMADPFHAPYGRAA